MVYVLRGIGWDIFTEILGATPYFYIFNLPSLGVGFREKARTMKFSP